MTVTAPETSAALKSPRQITLKPAREATAKSLLRLAAQIARTHPKMGVHPHLEDAADQVRLGNEDGALRHLRTAALSLSPQSLRRHGISDDRHHVSAQQALQGVLRHHNLVRDIQDAEAKNQAAIDRASYGDDTSSPPPARNGDPGALAQRPTARQPGGDRALNAPARANAGRVDVNVANPRGRQPRGSRQFARSWDEVEAVIGAVIELAAVPVRSYQRVNPRTGRVTVVRATTRQTQGIAAQAEDEEEAAKSAVDRSHIRGWVPQEKWLKGQQEWVARGKAARAAKEAAETPQHQYAHPESGQHEVAARQAAGAGDYDAALGHLKQMDRLEKRAGVGEGEGLRPKIAGTVAMLKSRKEDKQREVKNLLNERGQAAHRVADTARQAIAADAGVRTSLREASNALFRADHQGALRHLAEAKAASQAAGPNGRNTARTIAAHEKEVRQLADQARALAPFAPKGTVLQAASTAEAPKPEPARPAAKPGKITQRDLTAIRKRTGLDMGQPDAYRFGPQAKANYAEALGHLAAGRNDEALPAMDRFVASVREEGQAHPPARARQGNQAAESMRDKVRDAVRPKAEPSKFVGATHPQPGMSAADLRALAKRQLAQGNPNWAETAHKADALEGKPQWRKDMEERAAKEKAAAEANSRGMDRMMARTEARRTRIREALGIALPHRADLRLTSPAAIEKYEQVWDLLARGRYAEAEDRLASAAADENALKTNSTTFRKLVKLRATVQAATRSPKHGLLPPLAKVGREPDGSILAIDHQGNEYIISLKDGKVTVSRGGKTLSAAAEGDPTAVARRLAGQLAGTSLAVTWDDLSSVIELSARTPMLETTPAPLGRPGGPGLYRLRGNKHSDYLEQVVRALIEKRGMPKSRAYAIAWGALRRWQRGGGRVHPEVRAAASLGLKQEAAAAAKAKAAHAHAISWDDIAGAVELAAAHGGDGVSWEDVAGAIELAVVNVRTYQRTRMTPRGPVVQTVMQHPQQYRSGLGAPVPAARTPAPAALAPVRRPPARPPGRRQAPPNRAAQKQRLLATAASDRRRSALLSAQLAVFSAALMRALYGTNTTKAQKGATTAAQKGATTKATAPAPTKTQAAATTAAKAGNTPAAVKQAQAQAQAQAGKMSVNQLYKTISTLNAQIRQLNQQAATLTAQAAKL